jgi:hypothetical protein
VKSIITPAGSLAAAVFTACMAASAWGDTPPPPPPPPPAPNVMEACKHDVQTLCAGIAPGEGRIKACLKTNHQSLSPGCKEAIRERRRERMETPPPGAPASPPASPPPAAPPTNP